MSAHQVRFEVAGRPIPQGSARAFAGKGKAAGRAFITNDPTGSISKWRGDIRSAIADLRPDRPAAGPVRMVLIFGFARPKAHYLGLTSTRRVPVLRPDAPTFHLAAPDTDKLERAVLDALTGVVYLDDSQVFDVAGRKRWVEPGEPGLIAEVGWWDEVPTLATTSEAITDILAGVVADGQEALGL